MVDNKDYKQELIQSFLHLLTPNQHRIYGFIMSYVADWNLADDIFQETTVILWEKFQEYTPGTDFLAWAFKIAHFQVLSHIKKDKTKRKYFTSSTLEKLSDIAEVSAKESQKPLEALRKCIEKLSQRSKNLLALRYEDGQTVQKIARRTEKSVNILYKEYKKIHVALFKCVSRKMEWD